MPPDDDQTRTYVPLTGGTMVSHYRIIDKIGAGGMGEVYLADDTELGRKVALKFLPSHLCQDADCRTRFKREAQAAAKLDHPNIVSVFEVGEFQGRPFFSMQHVEGQSLKEVLAGKPLPLDRIVELGIQICDGLQAAHESGITHRDIKPSNILIDSHGRARIVDFGLASVLGTEPLTRTGSTLGTIGYMSPEQVRGDKVDHRSDLFALGIVLYELITGHSPFRADTEAAILHAITHEVPQPLARFHTQATADLQRIVSRLLDKNPALRYQSAADVGSELKRLPTAGKGEAFLSRGRNRTAWLVAGLSVVLLLVVGVLLVLNVFRQADRQAADHRTMLAVLPFVNLGEPEDEYFADGITEEITSRLVGIEGLGVISRTSAMQYRSSGKSLRQVGKELGVAYILEGSVRWARAEGASRVRITPQLVRVSDDRHLWADNYERELLEVFAVQQDIAARIVDQLGLAFLDSSRTEPAARPTADARAYDYYLRGISGYSRGTSGVYRLDWSVPTLTVAAAHLDTAVLIDSAFALAWAARSRVYSTLAFLSPSPVCGNLARESFDRALQLQPNLSYGHLAAGIYYNLVETDYNRALDELNRATAELHNDADLISNIAFVQFRRGNFAEASESFRRATELDPLNPTAHAARAEFFRFQKMFDESERSIDRAIALDHRRADFHLEKMLGYVSRYGDWNRIREVVRQALADVDAPEFVSTLISDKGYLTGLPMDSLFAGTGLDLVSILDQLRSTYRQKVDLDLYYCRMAVGFASVAGRAMAAVYLDSARTALEDRLQSTPDDWHRTAALGVVLSDLGLCERAEDMGTRGKGLLSIAKCHW